MQKQSVKLFFCTKESADFVTRAPRSYNTTGVSLCVPMSTHSHANMYTGMFPFCYRRTECRGERGREVPEMALLANGKTKL